MAGLDSYVHMHVCRGDLYGDITQNLHEVRQSVAESILRLKERLGLKEKEPTTAAVAAAAAAGGYEAGSTDDGATVLKSEGVKAIQDDNADLNKQVCGWVCLGGVVT